jgi:hypothetical protein
MEDMLPGNSFPQICVVSVNESVEKWELTQQYVGIVAQSNHLYYQMVNSWKSSISNIVSGRCRSFSYRAPFAGSRQVSQITHTREKGRQKGQKPGDPRKAQEAASGPKK